MVCSSSYGFRICYLCSFAALSGLPWNPGFSGALLLFGGNSGPDGIHGSNCSFCFTDNTLSDRKPKSDGKKCWSFLSGSSCPCCQETFIITALLCSLFLGEGVCGRGMTLVCRGVRGDHSSWRILPSSLVCYTKMRKLTLLTYESRVLFLSLEAGFELSKPVWFWVLPSQCSCVLQGSLLSIFKILNLWNRVTGTSLLLLL